MRAEVVWEVRDKRFFPFVLSLSSFNKLARRFGQYLREKRLSTGRGVTGSSKLRCGPGLSSRPEIKQCLANECRSDGQTAQQQETAQRCDCACVIYCCRDTIILFRRSAPINHRWAARSLSTVSNLFPPFSSREVTEQRWLRFRA